MALAIRRLTLVALALLLSLSSAACASGSRRGGGGGSMGGANEETTVRVENQAFFDVNIYVERPGDRVRLGDVTSQGTRVFRLPAGTAYGSVRFLVDPIGSNRTARSFDIQVIPGDQIRLTIPNF